MNHSTAPKLSFHNDNPAFNFVPCSSFELPKSKYLLTKKYFEEGNYIINPSFPNSRSFKF
jgi:hypothetical protein